MTRTETVSGFRFVTESNATKLRPGARVVSNEHAGTLLGFSVPRGYAIVNVGGGREVLVHPETLRAAGGDGRLFEKRAIEEVAGP